MYTMDEAAKLLLKNPITIKKWIRAGIFPNAVKKDMEERKNKTWFIPKEDVEEKKRELEVERGLYTTTDIAKILEIRPNLVLRAIKNGKFPNAVKYKTTELGANNVWMVPEEDICNLRNEIESKRALLIPEEKYYSVEEVLERITSFDREKIYKKLKKGLFPNAVKTDLLSFNRKEWIIPECDINRVLENIEEEKDYCLSINYIAEKLGVSRETIYLYIRTRKFKNVRIIDGKWFVSKKWFESNKDSLNPELRDKYYRIGDIVDIVNKSQIEIRREIAKMFPNAIFYSPGRCYLIPEMDVIQYQEEKLNEAQINENNIINILNAIEITGLSRHKLYSYIRNGYFSNVTKKGGTIYLHKEEVYKLKEDILQKRTTESISLSVEQVSEIIKKSKSVVHNLIRTGQIQAIGFKGKAIRVSMESLKKFLEIEKVIDNEYLTVKDIAHDMNIPLSTVKKLINRGNFPGAIKKYNMWKIPSLEYQRYKIKIQEEPKEPGDYIEKFKYRAKKLFSTNLHLKETIHLYISFFIKKFSSSQTNDRSSFFGNYFNALKSLVNVIDQEVFLYSDFEIDKLIESKIIKKTHWSKLTLFLNHVRVYEIDRCRFKKNHSFLQKQKRDSNKADEVYNKNVFFEYYKYTKDINIHLDNSIQSRVYTCTWLFVIMHFVDVWRKADVRKLPNIDIEVIGSKTLDWFNKNKMNEAKALKILNQLKDMNEMLVVGKTESHNMFTVHADMIIPVATVLVLAEMHRRKDGKPMLMDCFKKSNPSKRHYSRFFAGNPNLEPNFSNRKANKSMLTYTFYSVIEGNANGDIALAITKRLRAHTELSSTEIYLMTENEDGPLDNASLHLLRRGPMGWLYCIMIDILLESKGIELTMEQRTQLVEKYKQMFKPIEMERISDYFINRQNLMYSVAMEMVSLPPTVIKQKVEDICNGLMSSRLKDIPCFFSCKNCPYQRAECLGCPYIIPHIYMMTALKAELDDVLRKLDDLYEYRISERTRETNRLFGLMDLLKQIGVEYGKDFIDEFIDTKALLYKLNSINLKLIYFEREGPVVR